MTPNSIGRTNWANQRKATAQVGQELRGWGRNCEACPLQHFLDPCALVGHPSPAASDPTGVRFAFEKPVTTLAGGNAPHAVAHFLIFRFVPAIASHSSLLLSPLS